MAEEKEEVIVSREINTFIVETLRNPATKENPAMVAAITELCKVTFY